MTTDHLTERASSTPTLAVSKLTKSFGQGDNRNEVLGGLNLDVYPGEFVSLVGPSGSGKTTLLRCLSGLTPPTTGEIHLHGDPVTGPPDDLAVVFQDYRSSLLPWMRVLANVTLPLGRKKMSKADRQELGREMLTAVGLSGHESKYPWQLSGGMQQRVSIARALAYRPSLLVMDEPFASLDAQTRTDLEDLVLRLRVEFGQTVVFVTHDIDEAVYLSDRVFVLGGRPTVVQEVVDIDLPDHRDQVTTKSLPAFAAYRAHILEQIRRKSPDCEEREH